MTHFLFAELLKHNRETFMENRRLRTWGLEKGTPKPRQVQSADMGRVVSIPEVDGLHHRYERRAA
jgi:hypothetical protein